MKEIKEDPDKWKDVSFTWLRFMIERLNIVIMPILPQMIHRFNIIPIKILVEFFSEINRFILKFI